ncbi:condensin-2 complex subunit H2-like isoform X1 [Clavelina lepadiformis]|uniref:condensin-2 complex subunit H2-like isoform X1 n=1 Tax=Clavelina lepadiformis TaxID=159417 RepID=UPI0040433BB5
MNDLGQKYDFLLHPIKDLTKNWNIDIATVLEDYLGELETMTFSFDGGKTKLNFAEASFLIQGTACVWSRKVEYLHSLVYQTLEMISNNKQDKQPTSIDPKGIDKDDTFDDHEDKFLNLDDARTATAKMTTGSGGDVICIPLHSMYLHTAEEDRGMPFLSKSGEILNYYKDLWSNCMTPMTSGATLIARPFKNEVTLAKTDVNLANKEDIGADGDTTNNSPHQDADLFMGSLDDHHDDNDGDDYNDVDMAVEVDNAAVDVIEKRVEVRQLRQRAAPVSSTDIQPLIVDQKIEPILDPHSKCNGWTAKPFHKGKTVRLPSSIAPGRKRKRDPTQPTIPLLYDFLQASKKVMQQVNNAISDERKKRFTLWKQLKAEYAKQSVNPEFNQEEICDDVFTQSHVINGDGIEDDMDEPYSDDDGGGGMPNIDDLIHDAADYDAPAAPPPTRDIDHIETFEDLVRHHVEQFYTSAKLYIQETALGQRVKEWQQSIEPFLEDQDQRPEFDIHKYGDDMVLHFADIGQTKSFASVVNTKDPWSICRHFAATLQLANDGNFLLATDGDTSKDCVNTLQLKLLSQNKFRDRIEEYAPF